MTVIFTPTKPRSEPETFRRLDEIVADILTKLEKHRAKN